MVDFTHNLETMGAEQYVLAFVFLGSYALALGGFVGMRGRLVAAAVALASAAGFAGFSSPWEDGVMVAAMALIGMGLFTAAVWALWAVATWQHRRVARVAP
ncbi:hypothetical protein [Piscinibacter sp.]|uniref:hypothetical protein n=1 Tax=Piscinibacter sp. TaxID=1903157 RepID=UPI002D7FF576|nr:hypothetical protein [Albitalea sp.]